jgi:hypothetical protein
MTQALKSGFTLLHGDDVRSASTSEVRCAVRFPLMLPMTVYGADREQTAITRNVSASGVLFETQRPFLVGERIRFSLRMPRAILGTEHDVLVECRGRVVRSSVNHPLPQVAATIDDYQFVEQ